MITGLGVTTVSRALKDAPEIAEATRRRVQLVARQVGYRPNRAGVRLRTGKTNVIALILGTEEQAVFSIARLMFGMSEELAATPFHLIVTPQLTGADQLAAVRYVVETGSADAVVLTRTQRDDPRVRYLHENGMPFATHGRTEMGIEHAYHDFDNDTYARDAVATLAARGRRRLALLAPAPTMTYHFHMRAGFDAGLEQHALDEAPFHSASADSSVEEVVAAATALFARRERPEGVVCASGVGAIAVMAGAEANGLEVGKDVDIVTKQPLPNLSWFRDPIWVVDEDLHVAGRQLARHVVGELAGEDPATLRSIEAPSQPKLTQR